MLFFHFSDVFVKYVKGGGTAEIGDARERHPGTGVEEEPIGAAGVPCAAGRGGNASGEPGIGLASWSKTGCAASRDLQGEWNRLS